MRINGKFNEMTHKRHSWYQSGTVSVFIASFYLFILKNMTRTAEVIFMELEAIGKRIKERRTEIGMRQEELAEKAGLSPSYIGMIERGEKIPRLEPFVKILNILELSADEALADVLKKDYEAKTTKYTEQLEKLESFERKRVYEIIETLLKEK